MSTSKFDVSQTCRLVFLDAYWSISFITSSVPVIRQKQHICCSSGCLLLAGVRISWLCRCWSNRSYLPRVGIINKRVRQRGRFHAAAVEAADLTSKIVGMGQFEASKTRGSPFCAEFPQFFVFAPKYGDFRTGNWSRTAASCGAD